jgi:hypothetical protein
MSDQVKYNVEIVLCVDATGSMGPVISEVKANALRFYEDLTNNMDAKGKSIDHLRVKVIVFRDFYADGADAFIESPFYNLPVENVSFYDFVNKITAKGGGDDPENGMEALAVAIKGPWGTQGDKRRQIIVMWTDTSAHKLEKATGLKPANYPLDIPGNFDELTDAWEGQLHVIFSSKRLIIYSPDSYPWTDIANNWSNTIHYTSQAGLGLDEVEYNTIIDQIANSI